MVKLPAYIIEFQGKVDLISRYTGWKDQEFADKLGISVDHFRRLRRDPCCANGGLILRIEDMLREYRKKAGVI